MLKCLSMSDKNIKKRSIFSVISDYHKVSASFYWAVVQAIILYGSETWVLLASMEKRLEVRHTEFLRMITVKKAKQLGDGTW